MKKIILVILLLLITQQAYAKEYPRGLMGSPFIVHGDIGVAWVNSWRGSDKSYPTISKLTPAFSGNLDICAPKYQYIEDLFIRGQLNVDVRHEDNGRSASVGIFYKF